MVVAMTMGLPRGVGMPVGFGVVVTMVVTGFEEMSHAPGSETHVGRIGPGPR
jgi:hypothetical protein